MIAHQIGGAAAYQAAQQGAHQSQGRDLQAHPVLLAALMGLLTAWWPVTAVAWVTA